MSSAETGSQCNRDAVETRGRLFPILVMLGGVIPVGVAFWLAQAFENVYKDLGQKLPQVTVFAIQLAAMGRSSWGILISLVIVATLCWSLWRTHSRVPGTAMICVGVLGGIYLSAYVWLLLLPFLQMTESIK